MASQTEPGKKEVKRLVKFTVFIKKKPEISDEEFHRYWSEEHGTLVGNIPIFKEKVLRYTQFHSNVSLKRSCQLGGLRFEESEFDGVAEFLVADVETLFTVWHDPEFRKSVVPDGEKFQEPGAPKFMVGYEDVIMDNT